MEWVLNSRARVMLVERGFVSVARVTLRPAGRDGRQGHITSPKGKSMVMTIIWFIVVGLIAGLLARAIVPGKDAMGILPTVVLGIIGSFVGGAIAAVFSDRKVLDFNTSGILLSILGAIVALLIYNRIAASRGGSRTV
jgi:uncharacterized membrane protein YeaQ/YmgE (transglycosylase-associated protein family)